MWLVLELPGVDLGGHVLQSGPQEEGDLRGDGWDARCFRETGFARAVDVVGEGGSLLPRPPERPFLPAVVRVLFVSPRARSSGMPGLAAHADPDHRSCP